MKSSLKKFLAALTACAIVAGVAFAAVEFHPDTGTGFVGKGDVQLAFGWNNQTLQNNAKDVTFSYADSTEYSYTCEWFTGPTANRKRHDVTHTVTTGVISAVDADPRQTKGQKQFTGFILNGFGSDYSESGFIPVEGGACPGTDGTGAVIIDTPEDPITTGTTTGTLTAAWGTLSAVVWSN